MRSISPKSTAIPPSSSLGVCSVSQDWPAHDLWRYFGLTAQGMFRHGPDSELQPKLYFIDPKSPQQIHQAPWGARSPQGEGTRYWAPLDQCEQPGRRRVVVPATRIWTQEDDRRSEVTLPRPMLLAATTSSTGDSLTLVLAFNLIGNRRASVNSLDFHDAALWATAS